MRNLHKLLIILISVVFIASGAIAQSDVSPKLDDQLKSEKQKKAQKAALMLQMKGASESAPMPMEDAQKGIYLEKVPGDYVTDVSPDAKISVIASDAMFDLQFDWPVGVGGGEAGIETDGNYIYTTKWNGVDFYRYNMDGTYIESFTCGSAGSIRDLAFDGTYFYGGAASTTVFQMDFNIPDVISTFTAPTDCRAIAYNEDDDAFYANNWGSAITKFDMTGANLGSFPVGPTGDSYYGFAYDGYSGGTYLWGYAQVGATLNELVQIELPAGTETGVYFDVGSVAAVGAGIAGGMCIDDNLVTGFWTIMGTAQNEDIWGVELVPSGPPASIDVGVTAILEPVSGTGLTADEQVTITVKNFGTETQSDFDVYFTLDGGTPVTESISGTLNQGETLDHTFSTTVDLSTPGDYDIVACTDLEDDENPGNDCKSTTVSNLTQAWVYPQSADYWTGTTDGTSKTETSYVKAWGGSGGNEQGWMSFDISSIPQNSLVNWIKFHGYVTNTYYPYWSITPMPIDPVTATAADIWNTASAGSASAVAYAYNNESSTFAPGWHEYDLVNSANDDLAAAINSGQGWFAVGIWERDGSNTYYLELDGWNETNIPWLEIDYTILDFGSIEGTVTELASGNPVENAMITAVGPNFTYEVTTGADGTYLIDPAQDGEYTVTCEKDGYNIVTVTGVMVTAGSVTTQDFELTSPTMEIDPLTVSITLDPNTQGTEYVDISNNGDGLLGWNAQLELLSDNTDAMFDLIWDVPVGVGGGEAGIETNGTYIYTTKWNGTGEYYRYGMDGTYIEQITVSGAAATRDMAYNGTYFYGGAASTTVFELDLDNASLISTFTAPTDCRAIAYNDDDDAFYANNWGSAITKFDMTGANLGSFPVGPVGDSYYGFAYNNSEGTPYLWGYAQVGATLNELVQIELPSGTETGLTFDVGSVAAVGTGIAGGLAIDDHIVAGLWAFLGTSQNVNLWALELGPAGPVWLTIDPTSGTLDPGTTQDMDLNFDATGLLPGVYEAEIHFSTNPNVGEPVVEVTLTVAGLIPAINLNAVYNCTDVELDWEMPTGGDPDSWKVYRDGEEIADVTAMEYTDEMVDPDVEYSYTVTAVYAGEESQPTPPTLITVPVPDDLEATGLEGIANIPNQNDVTLTWDEPAACLAPDSYSIYRDGNMIADGVTALEYVDPALSAGFYEYYVVAVYYFGESAASEPAYVLITGIEDYAASLFRIFPNPATEIVNVKSPVEITRIHVLNNHGQLVLDKEVNNMEYQINVSKYEAGIYFIKLETSEGIIIRKVAVK